MPALAYLNVNGGMLAPVKSVKNNAVTWLDTQNGWQTESITSFQQKWDGVALLIEPNQQSGESDYYRKNEKEWVDNARLPILAGGLIVVFIMLAMLIWNRETQAYLYLFLGVKLAGTLLAGLLLWQSVDTDNPFLQSFCQVGNRNNCNSILRSKAANVTPWLSWSEVGYIYFAGGLLSILFAFLSRNNSIIIIIELLAIVALPYTVYSVYYQKFVARQWCKLCMAVQVVLWVEAILALVNISQFQNAWNMQSALLISLAFLIPTLLWIFIKHPVYQASQVFDLQRELQKVKFDENYIRSTFQNQPQMPPVFEDMPVVRLGGNEAEHIVTVVTNPLCQPCTKLHSELLQLLADQSNIKCQFIFIGPFKAMRVAAELLAAPERHVKILMDSWYSNNKQDVDEWILSNNSNERSSNAEQGLALHPRWCQLAGIDVTPTLFLNGSKLATPYQLKDIPRIIAVANFSATIPSV
ncbi:peptidase C39 bacteriocin processing [Dyadobacter psychrotolerans]|uniref:Peptidase C39 bacteriocin processing n=1 Tax=Dyadobacter psychrotolerans TaxID=2541721 RepID=A0A4R5D989_9BACT|nr:peptidase C39 bacteriocin processing [Dyadobacter psychrotolerans]